MNAAWSRLQSSFLSVLWLVFFSGCGSLHVPQTTMYVPRYERSALVPGPSAPQFTGEPLPVGAVDMGSRVAVRSGGEQHLVEADQVGVRVPDLDVSAGALVGATSWLSVGGELRVSNAAASSATTADTARLPSGARSVFSLGPEVAIGGHFGQGNALFIGGSFSASLTRIGWGSYELVRGRYLETSEGTAVVVTPRFAVLAGGRATKWLSIFAGAVLAPQIVNVGFSDAPIEGSTLRSDGSVFMPLLGTRIDLGHDPGVFLRAAVTAPVGTRYVSFSHFAMDAGFGVRIR